MKEHIEKMIAEYKAKLNDTDVLLDVAGESIRRDRKANNKDLYMIHRKEQAALFAQRQCYVQAIADFDSLLDYV